jgi:predicted dehydrogenase
MVAAVAANKIKLVQDQPLIRFNAPFARLLSDVGGEPLGKVVSYYHNFGMNFAREFSIALKWPELLAPAEKMGGGEIAHLGGQALDFAIALLGRPMRVHARWRHNWPAYQRAGVENFGQVIMDYGYFFAALAVGRQQLEGGFNHSHCMHVVAEGKTLLLDGTNGLIFRNNVPIAWEQYMRGFEAETGLDQLLRCIEEDATPDSSVEVAADGMEVLMAVYRSILDNKPVDLPLGDGANPLQK